MDALLSRLVRSIALCLKGYHFTAGSIRRDRRCSHAIPHVFAAGPQVTKTIDNVDLYQALGHVDQ